TRTHRDHGADCGKWRFWVGSHRRGETTGGEAMDTAAIDGLLERAVEEGAVPGVVAVAGDRDGTLYEGAHGRLSGDGEGRVGGDTVLAIASMTKPLARVGGLELRERGRGEI